MPKEKQSFDYHIERTKSEQQNIGLEGNNKTQLRVPKPPSDAARGVGKSIELIPPKPLSLEESLVKFGPCHLEVNQTQTAILMLQSSEDQIIIQALNSLQKYAKKKEENKQIIVDLGGLCYLIRLIYHDNSIVQRLSMKLVAMTSVIHKAKLFLRNCDITKEIVYLASCKDPVVQEYATFILCSLASLYTGRILILQNDTGTNTLIKLLGHTDPDIQKNAAETIWRLLEEPSNIKKFISMGTVQQLKDLSNSEYPAIQICALSILEQISKIRAGADAIDAANGVEFLDEKLSKKHFGDLHRVCLRICINLAANKHLVHKVASAIPVAVELMDHSSDEMVRTNSIHLLGLLSYVPVVARGLVSNEIPFKLVRLMSSNPSLKIREEIIFTAAQLSQTNLEAKKAFYAMIEQVINHLKTGETSTKGLEYVMVFLCAIVEGGQQACQNIYESGGIKVLLDIFKSRSEWSQDAMISTLHCINLIGLHWEYRQKCAEAGFVGEILRCVQETKNPQLLTACGSTLCLLLCEQIGRDEFIDLDGAEVLIKMITHEEYPVIVAAAPIILTAGSFPKVCSKLVESQLLHLMWKRQDVICTNPGLRSAFERLLTNYLPAKLAVTDRIDAYEKLPNGFYEFGPLSRSEKFLTLAQLTDKENESLTDTKSVIYLNLFFSLNTEGKNIPFQEIATEDNRKLLPVCTYIDTIRANIGDKQTEKELVRGIARFVVERMGGPIDHSKGSIYAEQLEIANLQKKHKSPVVLITEIENGAYRARSILFKALADAFEVPCTLERGDQNKMWNTVSIKSKQNHSCHCELKGNPDAERFLNRKYIVDLATDATNLYPIGLYDANLYCFSE